MDSNWNHRIHTKAVREVIDAVMKLNGAVTMADEAIKRGP